MPNDLRLRTNGFEPVYDASDVLQAYFHLLPMTEQVPESLINHCPLVDFGDLCVCGVLSSDPRKGPVIEDYTFQKQPTPREMGTACWRGYIAEFELNPEGELTLLSYRYSDDSLQRNPEREIINEKLSGDFWLEMRTGFDDPTVIVPFRNGRIVADEGQWYSEEKKTITALKFPERTVWSIHDVIPNLFLGEVKTVAIDKYNSDELHFTVDRDFPRGFSYCRVKFLRDSRVIYEEKIVGQGGTGAGPWHWIILRPLGEQIQVGDEIWASGKEVGRTVPEGVPRLPEP